MVHASHWNHPPHTYIIIHCPLLFPQVVVLFLQAILLSVTGSKKPNHCALLKYQDTVDVWNNFLYQSFGMWWFPVLVISKKTNCHSYVMNHVNPDLLTQEPAFPAFPYQTLPVLYPRNDWRKLPLCVCQWAPATGHMIEHVATYIIRSTLSRCDRHKCSHHLTVSLCTTSLYHKYTLCCAPNI